MGITAVTSNAIVDSTATGRDLITAANAAAGRDALEILDSSYDWTGDHYFEAESRTQLAARGTNSDR